MQNGNRTLSVLKAFPVRFLLIVTVTLMLILDWLSNNRQSKRLNPGVMAFSLAELEKEARNKVLTH